MLDGLRILVLDDDFLAALGMCDLLEAQGATVVGPAGRLDQARTLADEYELDGAIIDVNLGNESGIPLADELIAAKIPVILASGYRRESLPNRFAETPMIPKPLVDVNFAQVIRNVFVG